MGPYHQVPPWHSTLGGAEEGAWFGSASWQWRVSTGTWGYLQQKPLGFRTSLPVPRRSVSLLPGAEQMEEEKKTLVTFKGKKGVLHPAPCRLRGRGILHRPPPQSRDRGSSLLLSLGHNNGVTCLAPEASVFPAAEGSSTAAGPTC